METQTPFTDADIGGDSSSEVCMYVGKIDAYTHTHKMHIHTLTSSEVSMYVGR